MKIKEKMEIAEKEIAEKILNILEKQFEEYRHTKECNPYDMAVICHNILNYKTILEKEEIQKDRKEEK